MDITDRIKYFINDTMQSLFVKQKEDFSFAIHKEANALKSEIESCVRGNSQMHERDIANIQQSVFALNQRLQILFEKMDSMQLSLEEIQKSISETKSNEKINPTKPITQHQTVYYAKMVDSANPIGFSISNLKDTEDGCAFKITLYDGLEGHYEMIDDADIQQEILSAFNPLVSDSSEYDFIPQNPTQIIVMQSGNVVLEDKILKITKKQKIKML